MGVYKLFIYYLIAAFYFLSSYTSHAGEWIRVDSLNYTFYINISCADTSNCIALGHHGAYARTRLTTDGGKSWATAYEDSVTPDHLPPEAFSVAYPDTGLCIIALDSGYYCQSNDKCRTWEKKRYRDSAYKIYESRIYTFGSSFISVLESQNIFLTRDGGINWENVKIEIPDSVYSFLSMSLPTQNTIVILYLKIIIPFEKDSTYIIRSDDGGNTWNKFQFNDNRRLREIVFIDSLNGWAIGSPKVNTNTRMDLIKYTSDGGKSWETQLDNITPIAPQGLWELRCIDQNNAIALGPWWHLWRTSDGGKRWLRDTTYNQVFSGGIMSDYFVDAAYLKNKTIIGVQGLGSSIYKWEENATGVGIEPVIDGEINLYPNPAVTNDVLQIESRFTAPGALKLEIFTSLGESVDESASTEITLYNQLIRYRLPPGLQSGSYILKFIYNGKFSCSKQLIILK